MTSQGGANNDGVMFSIPVTGGTPTTLFDFDNTHGASPWGDLALSGSTLYGMTQYGGVSPGWGTIFSIPVTGGTPTTLFDFDITHGANPRGSLTLSGSTLYGMTWNGGAANNGVIFSLAVPEPATFGLAAFGAVALLAARRRLP
jgi:uncharacterized repeat protein (TIGR03803 family)